MIPYLIVFSLSIICMFYAQKYRDNTIHFYFFLLIAMFVPAFLAGFRDPTVGTDLRIYVNGSWQEIVKTNSIQQLISKAESGYYDASDKGYLLLNYILSYISKDVHTVYFGISLFILFFFFLTVKENRNRVSMPLMTLLFLFIYYNYSLNVMRQTMAMSLCLYSFKFVEKREWIKVLICIPIITIFHSTGIFFLLCILVYVAYYIKNVFLRYAIFALGILSILSAFFYYDKILLLIITYSFIPEHYSMYISQEQGVFQTSMLITYLVFEAVFLYAYSIARMAIIKRELLFYAMFHLIGILMSTLSIVMYDAYRVSLYFLFISISLFLPRTLFYISKRRNVHYHTILFVVISLSIFAWFYVNILNGFNETYPYKSKTLGI